MISDNQGKRSAGERTGKQDSVMASAGERKETSRTGPAQSDMEIVTKSSRTGPAESKMPITAKTNRKGPAESGIAITATVSRAGPVQSDIGTAGNTIW